LQVQKLRQWREFRALTQEELAEKAGISPRSVAGYEGGAGARPGTVRALAAALDVDVSALLEEPQTPKAQAPPSPESAQGRRPSGFTEVVPEDLADAVDRYRDLRNHIADFEGLDPQTRRRVLEASLLLYQELRAAYDPRDLTLALLHDVLFEAVLRMLGIYELDEERGRAGVDVIDIGEYKAMLGKSA
jgi:transcriptional regulator with XRE-family HTH domain